jgi:hypothetical protein
LDPSGTYYSVTAEGIYGIHYVDYYNECLKIVGKAPINLNALIPITEGELRELNEAASPYYNPPEVVRRIRVPAPRKPGSTANHVGFFAVTIGYPARTGTTGVPAISEQRVFGVRAFTLPFRAVIGCASVIVDSPALGKEVIVGLYDASGKRVCATAIDVSKCGVATGEFPIPVPLNAGDYLLAYGVNRFSSTHRGGERSDVSRERGRGCDRFWIWEDSQRRIAPRETRTRRGGVSRTCSTTTRIFQRIRSRIARTC